jgi:protoporphyrinogen oxidase
LPFRRKIKLIVLFLSLALLACCKDISADWAKQRIKGLSLRVAIQKALFGFKKNIPKTLSNTFLYPKSGAGEFYILLKDSIMEIGSQFKLGKTVTRIRHDNHKIIALGIQRPQDTREEECSVEYLFSSMPLPILIQMLEPQPPKDVAMAAQRLRFRSFLIVNIILEKEDIFPDQWLYVHSPEVRTYSKLQELEPRDGG